jgi:hypothetical protein
MSWESALTAVLALATLGLVGVTYFLARVTNKQVGVSQATLAASQCPFLAPISTLTLTSDGDRKHYDFQQLDPDEQVTVKNPGPGLALNVSGVLVQPRPDAVVEMNIAPKLRYLTYGTPVLSGDEITPPMRGGGHIISWDTHVGKDPENTLVAPKAPTLGGVQGWRVSQCRSPDNHLRRHSGDHLRKSV